MANDFVHTQDEDDDDAYSIASLVRNRKRSEERAAVEAEKAQKARESAAVAAAIAASARMRQQAQEFETGTVQRLSSSSKNKKKKTKSKAVEDDIPTTEFVVLENPQTISRTETESDESAPVEDVESASGVDHGSDVTTKRGNRTKAEKKKRKNKAKVASTDKSDDAVESSSLAVGRIVPFESKHSHIFKSNTGASIIEDDHDANDSFQPIMSKQSHATEQNSNDDNDHDGQGSDNDDSSALLLESDDEYLKSWENQHDVDTDRKAPLHETDDNEDTPSANDNDDDDSDTGNNPRHQSRRPKKSTKRQDASDRPTVSKAQDEDTDSVEISPVAYAVPFDDLFPYESSDDNHNSSGDVKNNEKWNEESRLEKQDPAFPDADADGSYEDFGVEHDFYPTGEDEDNSQYNDTYNDVVHDGPDIEKNDQDLSERNDPESPRDSNDQDLSERNDPESPRDKTDDDPKSGMCGERCLLKCITILLLLVVLALGVAFIIFLVRSLSDATPVEQQSSQTASPSTLATTSTPSLRPVAAPIVKPIPTTTTPTAIIDPVPSPTLSTGGSDGSLISPEPTLGGPAVVPPSPPTLTPTTGRIRLPVTVDTGIPTAVPISEPTIGPKDSAGPTLAIDAPTPTSGSVAIVDPVVPTPGSVALPGPSAEAPSLAPASVVVSIPSAPTTLLTPSPMGGSAALPGPTSTIGTSSPADSAIWAGPTSSVLASPPSTGSVTISDASTTTPTTGSVVIP